MNSSPAPVLDPGSILDRIYSLYRCHIHPRHQARFLALLDCAPSGEPDAQWTINLLNVLDTLVDPWRPISKKERKTRIEIRRSCMAQLHKQQPPRLRQGGSELPL